MGRAYTILAVPPKLCLRQLLCAVSGAPVKFIIRRSGVEKYARLLPFTNRQLSEKRLTYRFSINALFIMLYWIKFIIAFTETASSEKWKNTFY